MQTALSSGGYCSVGRTLLLQLGLCDYRQKSEDVITCGGSDKERQEAESLSTEEYQKSEICYAIAALETFFLEVLKNTW